MRRFAVMIYGLLAYLAFLLPIGYLVCFLADAGVPKTVNRGAGPVGPALLVDLALLVLFGLQHSVMARPGFKRRFRRWIPDSIERSTYVLVSGLVLSVLFWLWRPIPAVLWDVSGTRLEWLAWTGFASGWALAVWATFALSHLHLFGLAQVSAWARRAEHPRLGLRTPLLYRVVRHPMTAGLILAFWSTPRMTLGHLVFALGMTVYSLGATILEEWDLLHEFRRAYREYRHRVPALVPVLRPGLLAPRNGGLRFELSVVLATLGLLSLLLLRSDDPSPTATGPIPELERGVLTSGGARRSHRVFAGPTSAQPRLSGGRRSRPLIVALHGTGGDGNRLRGFLGGELERVAREKGWIVAYPDAWGAAWNDCRKRAESVGRSAGLSARDAGIDDVGYLRSLVERLSKTHGADPERVFILGYSGGGHMAYRTALEAPDLVRAVAVFGANLPVEDESVCSDDESRSIPPVMVVNGTRDLINPFDGGDVLTPTGVHLGTVRSSAETIARLRRRSSTPEGVILVEVEGGGHVVPGPASRFPDAAGRNVRSRAGVQEAVDFFARAGQLSLTSPSPVPELSGGRGTSMDTRSR